MPLELEGPTDRHLTAGPIVIGLVNNMPDAALKATEAQFASLLAEASGSRQVRLRLSYLPAVPRSPEALRHIRASYWPLDQLLGGIPDALIVTGTEPRSPALEDEPYWGQMVRLLEWARAHAASSIWSCLAAHAAVQALDGIRRRRLSEKRFGVFEHAALADIPLLRGVGSSLLTPHSRWNELPIEDLRAAGYTIGSVSPEGDADLIVRAERGLLVCFQGHPEYEATSLLLEYRRDVGRFLRGESAAWPTEPCGYFSARSRELLERFRERAEPLRDPAQFDEFPTSELAAGTEARWRPAALRVYRNWVSYLAEARTGARSRRHARV